MGLEERVHTRIRLRRWYPLRKIAGLQTFECLGRDNLTPVLFCGRRTIECIWARESRSCFLISEPARARTLTLHLSRASSDLAQIYDPWLCTSDIYSNLGHRFSFLTYPLHKGSVKLEFNQDGSRIS